MTPARHVVVDGQLNRRPARLLLDTGADVSVVTAAAPAEYRMQRLRQQTRIDGSAGVVMADLVSARIGLGGDENWRQMPVIDFPATIDGDFAALLGLDVLRAYDVEVSIPERRVRLWQTAGCAGRYALWGGEYWAVPLDLSLSGLPRTTVTVDGNPVTALLDTGASTSILTRSAARRLGVTDAMLTRRIGTNSGIGGDAAPIFLARFNTLSIGPEALPPFLPVADIRAAGTGMLLGADWLRTRRIWISWSARQMFVQSADAIRPPDAGSPAATVP